MLQRQLFSLTLVSFTIITTLAVCKPSSKLDRTKQTTNSERKDNNDRCNQTITYHSDKLRAKNNEADADLNIVINPTTKIITLRADIPSTQEKATFDTVIESIDCNLNADLTEGYSIYKGYIKQLDGISSKATLKVEAKDGKLTITDPTQVNIAINISKWSVAP
jgi:hypothetical protein